MIFPGRIEGNVSRWVCAILPYVQGKTELGFKILNYFQSNGKGQAMLFDGFVYRKDKGPNDTRAGSCTYWVCLEPK